MEFFYKDTCLISEKDIKKTGEIIAPYLRHLRTVSQINTYDFPESSINLPFDNDLLEDVLKVKKEKVTGKLKYLIVVGIGGSNLGARAVYDALRGYFDILEPDRFPKIIFLDTNDPAFLRKTEEFLNLKVKKPEEVLINAISQSGETTETIVNLEFIVNILKRCFTEAKNRLVITTEFQSKFWEIAKEKGILALRLPEKVGGRYSVFSSVGLFPLVSVGIDIKELLNGAKEMREQCLKEDFLKNPAILSAITLFLNFKRGKIINDNFLFHPELESLGKWYRQLIAESLGKEKDIDGNIVNTGITPTVSIGSIDLHSMAQLYLGGPKDKFTTFVWSGNDKIMKAIYEGVKRAYIKKGLPFAEVILPDISAYSLGQFLQFKMTEMMLLGNLMHVNAFNQPNIEDYKKEIRDIL